MAAWFEVDEVEVLGFLATDCEAAPFGGALFLGGILIVCLEVMVGCGWRKLLFLWKRILGFWVEVKRR